MYQPRSRRLRNPDQLRRHERYHCAMGEFRNVTLDDKPQLKGRMTGDFEELVAGTQGGGHLDLDFFRYARLDSTVYKRHLLAARLFACLGPRDQPMESTM
jgi:hypothetical protein